MRVETQAQADALNESGEYGPYRAANGHLMIAAVRYPKDGEYHIGDTVMYSSWDAWCAPTCDHRELGALEDW